MIGGGEGGTGWLLVILCPMQHSACQVNCRVGSVRELSVTPSQRHFIVSSGFGAGLS